MSTPEVFFRETIDLGRYSNSVSRKFENALEICQKTCQDCSVEVMAVSYTHLTLPTSDLV